MLLFPEIPFDEAAFLAAVDRKTKEHGYCCIGVSEGLQDAEGRLMAEAGTRDAFGTIPELEAALALIPAKTRLIRVEGAGHDLRRGRFDWGPAVAGLATGR